MPRKQQLAARKMAKKGGTASFQVELNSDEEWKYFVQKEGLLVIDVYSEWCGPCVGMMSNLKKLKLEIGSEYLHLAMANADKIKPLSRFKGTSEPTWVFIATGQLQKVMYGSNAPHLMKTIVSELDTEMQCISGERIRLKRALTTLTPEEEEKMQEKEAKQQAEEEIERKELEVERDKVRRRYLERLARQINKQSVMLYFPQAITEEAETKKRVCAAAYKLMSLYDTVQMSIRDQMDVQLTEETIPQVFYNSAITLPDELIEEIQKSPCMASLLQEYDMGEEEEEEFMTPSMIRLRNLRNIERLDVVEKKLSQLVYGEAMDPNNPDPESIAALFTEVKGEDENIIKIPALWTPLDHISKAAALRILFPSVLEELEIVEETLPPPAYIMIFEAARAREILDAAEPFATDVLHIAFFNSEDPEKAEKVCQTIHELEKLPSNVLADAKMVIALQKTRSDPMLVLAQMGPLYLSSDTKKGTKEVDKFFPPTIEEIEEPDPWGPPPYEEDGFFMVDLNGNRYREEYLEDEKGEARLMKHIIRLADGTPADEYVEFGFGAFPSFVDKEKDASAIPSKAIIPSEEGSAGGEDSEIPEMPRMSEAGDEENQLDGDEAAPAADEPVDEGAPPSGDVPPPEVAPPPAAEPSKASTEGAQ